MVEIFSLRGNQTIISETGTSVAYRFFPHIFTILKVTLICVYFCICIHVHFRIAEFQWYKWRAFLLLSLPLKLTSIEHSKMHSFFLNFSPSLSRPKQFSLWSLWLCNGFHFICYTHSAFFFAICTMHTVKRKEEKKQAKNNTLDGYYDAG